jgi:hypothetical protein
MILKELKDIEIYKHGKEYIEQADIDYPPSICPECFSIDTSIDKKPMSYLSTGSSKHIRSGIFMNKYLFVNYKCRNCGCMWQKTYNQIKSNNILKRDVFVPLVEVLSGTFLFILFMFVTVCFALVHGNDKLSQSSTLIAIFLVTALVASCMLVISGIVNWIDY